MKSLFVLGFLAVVTVVFAVPRERRNILEGIDTKNIPAVINNPSAVAAHVKCITASDADAETLCDKTGKKIRVGGVEAIKTGTCPPPCTEENKKVIANVLVTFKQKYPDHWKTLSDHFKLTPEQVAKLEEFMKGGVSYR